MLLTGCVRCFSFQGDAPSVEMMGWWSGFSPCSCVVAEWFFFSLFSASLCWIGSFFIVYYQGRDVAKPLFLEKPAQTTAADTTAKLCQPE